MRVLYLHAIKMILCDGCMSTQGTQGTQGRLGQAAGARLEEAQAAGPNPASWLQQKGHWWLLSPCLDEDPRATSKVTPGPRVGHFLLFLLVNLSFPTGKGGFAWAEQPCPGSCSVSKRGFAQDGSREQPVLLVGWE